MEIRLAKTAGFCFGVNRAVELTYNLLNEGHKVATLGPLIHNPQAVADMERRGALVADTVDDIPTGYEVIIRSHGVKSLESFGVLSWIKRSIISLYSSAVSNPKIWWLTYSM